LWAAHGRDERGVAGRVVDLGDVRRNARAGRARLEAVSELEEIRDGQLRVSVRRHIDAVQLESEGEANGCRDACSLDDSDANAARGEREERRNQCAVVRADRVEI